jgi:hypothetical protein
VGVTVVREDLRQLLVVATIYQMDLEQQEGRRSARLQQAIDRIGATATSAEWQPKRPRPPAEQAPTTRAERFLAAAREYRSWDEPRMESELQRLAAERNCELRISNTDRGTWLVAFVQDDPLGTATLISSETETRHESMENVLLMAALE